MNLCRLTSLRNKIFKNGGLFLIFLTEKARKCEYKCLEVFYEHLTATVLSDTYLGKRGRKEHLVG